MTTAELCEALAKALPARGPSFVRLHILLHQLSYLNQLSLFLADQARDRKIRENKMWRISTVWRRNPSMSIGDKRKWLVDVPKIKAESLSKQIDFCRRLQTALAGFEDEAGYASLLRAGTPFLPFDFLVAYARKSIPHEGFNRMAIAELGGYRQNSAQDRADYRVLDGIVKQDAKARSRMSSGHVPHVHVSHGHMGPGPIYYEDELLVLDPGLLIEDALYYEPGDAFADDGLEQGLDADYADADYGGDIDGADVLEALVEEGVSDGMMDDAS